MKVVFQPSIFRFENVSFRELWLVVVPLRIGGKLSYQMTCWMGGTKKIGGWDSRTFQYDSRNCNFANFLPGSLLSRFPMFLFFEKSFFCFDSSSNGSGFVRQHPEIPRRKPLVHPPKLTCPLKGTISVGNISSNHWFSTDMLVFRGPRE